ncbi:copper chaperone PCu(A)C [Hoyosella sp. G463]|uniref:Copper chaperone PCu(A)C n=1 Tax=Lolliginicoccus lacisalsi TaxID=2742202 RepID=A0A927JDQ0_9ACTN|nr:copper chaperone PCu(A)C [Lolliginicoccus lacisalsi]MBD8507443.1 copper chaperone PCu(A)C [Lolliginicoccus lacisalsi]
MKTTRAIRMLAILPAAGVVLVAGCSNDPSPAPSDQASSVTITDAWVRAAQDGMVPAFAQLANTTDQAVRLSSVESAASGSTEIHEVVTPDGAPVMREKDGGLVIEPGTTYRLEPGADHLMLMGLLDPIDPGEDIPITLRFADGTSQEVVFTGRDFAGGTEEYQPGMEHDTGSGNEH